MLRTHCCSFLGAQTRGTKWVLCFHAAQTGKHLVRTQNASEQNQKHFLCRQQISVARAGKRRNICVGNNVSFGRAFNNRFVSKVLSQFYCNTRANAFNVCVKTNNREIHLSVRICMCRVTRHR